jgi:hypothetical protein
MAVRWQLLIGWLLLLLCACEELERSNPLDPKNPRSERRRVVFIEAFVNDGTPFSGFALAALDSLAAAFPQEQVVIIAHHLPSSNFPDAQALPESADRYNNLAAANPGVPDVFVNGSSIRVQGASSTRNALMRYRIALQPELGKSAHFTIEARKNISGTTITVDVTIARLGNSSFSRFAVGAMVWEDLGTAEHHHVARKVFPPESFNGIEAGERKTAQFTASLPGTMNMERLQVAAIIEQTANPGREVLQVSLAE